MKKTALNYVYLSRNHAGGKDQVGLNLLKGFYENGVSSQMLVICYDYSVDIIRELAPDIEIYQIKSPKSTNEFIRLLSQTYFNTILLPMIIKKKNIECIFHLAINNGLRRLPCKTIILPHDIKQIAHRKLNKVKVPMYKYILYKIMYYLDFKHADRIIAISDCDKKEMYNYYPQYRTKIIRIYNPIMVRNFEETEGVTDFPYILAVNLQFLHKNVITLIKAYEKIQNQIEQKLVLVGNIPKRVEFLEEYVVNHNLSSRVLFTGFVSEEVMDKYMKNTDLYVNPTLFEGFGMTAVEAIWKHASCLLSDLAVNREITKGLCTYYGPADDVDILANKIMECIKNPVSIDKRYEAAEIMRKSYDYRVISKKYIMLFEEP